MTPRDMGGADVAGLDDVNRDGIDDVVLGTYGGSYRGRDGAGAALEQDRKQASWGT